MQSVKISLLAATAPSATEEHVRPTKSVSTTPRNGSMSVFSSAGTAMARISAFSAARAAALAAREASSGASSVRLGAVAQQRTPPALGGRSGGGPCQRRKAQQPPPARAVASSARTGGRPRAGGVRCQHWRPHSNGAEDAAVSRLLLRPRLPPASNSTRRAGTLLSSEPVAPACAREPTAATNSLSGRSGRCRPRCCRSGPLHAPHKH